MSQWAKLGTGLRQFVYLISLITVQTTLEKYV